MKNTLLAVEGDSKTTGKISNDSNKQVSKQVDFLLCPLCFWCASYFNLGKTTNISCPMCYNNHIDQLPVSIDEA